MFAVIGTVDNYTILPSPVLDDADPKGYRIEQRLQVTLKLAANERQQYTVEFRLGDDSQAPSTDLLTKWLESGELVQAYCAGLAARPFVHSKEKTYQRRGRAVQIGEQTAELDAFVVFAGSAMAVLEPGSPLEEQVKHARAVYKRSQRAYRDQRNAARVAQMEAQLEERVRQMRTEIREHLPFMSSTTAVMAGVGAVSPPTVRTVTDRCGTASASSRNCFNWMLSALLARRSHGGAARWRALSDAHHRSPAIAGVGAPRCGFNQFKALGGMLYEQGRADGPG